ncbi:MAG: tRNA (adenosine(37)-N6)-dimethylallyltransferase MiaA [Actinomycetaceae bacterium]|nr:tRNA (adenosine(37)-N6)-dimethylallyltransferase MiaA [Actinomycetaceae bacterium]
MRIAIVGQTGSGKSQTAIELAHLLGGKKAGHAIVSADAYQLYRGMDIGTAKVLPHETRGIDHFQIDVLDIEEKASVAAYQRSARKDCQKINDAGGIPIMVGGSGLYIRAVLDDLQFPGTDPQLRAEIEQRGRSEGWQSLHNELRERDPVSAERIAVQNTRRVVRALEVCHLTKKPFSATLPTYNYVDDWIQIGLRWPQSVLETMIAHRSATMFTDGWLNEIEVLLAQGFEQTPTAIRACGYREAIEVFRGTISLDEGIDEVTRQTIRLAKRQWKWFKRDPRIHWIDMSEFPKEEAAIHAAQIALKLVNLHLE